MDFLNQLKQAKKTCRIDNNVKKILYELEDGRQMVEEYNMYQGRVLNRAVRRSWKKPAIIQQNDYWEIELGDLPQNTDNVEGVVSQEPIVSRRIDKTNLEWRIKDLPYPIETYSVTVNPNKKTLVVRTTNKKYYKVLKIPELERLHVVPKQEFVTFIHRQRLNTLIIMYKKPKELIEFENAILKEVENLPVKNYFDEVFEESAKMYSQLFGANQQEEKNDFLILKTREDEK